MAKDLENRITNTPKKPPSLADNIRAMEQQFSMAMPKGMEAQQLVRDALTCLRQTPGLMTCTQESVLGGLMTCSQLGLRPGVLGHAWLIPFTNRAAGTREATLVIGYQGLIDLAYRSGKVQSLVARTVYENDVFDVDYGLDDKLVHKPIINGEKGEPVAYYAIVKYTGGGHAFYVMSHTEMLRYRRMYAKSPDRGPWNEHFEKMAWKGLALDTPLPTPTGWTTMGEVKTGDTLFDMHGKQTTVIGKSEVKNIGCYRVTFNNGAEIICDEEHRWVAGIGKNARREINSKGWKVHTITELFEAKNNDEPVVMPVTGQIDCEEKDLQVNPWVLGYWLGNGSKRCATISCDRQDKDDIVQLLEDNGEQIGAIRHDPRGNAVSIGVRGGLITRLRNIGVLNNKHIPADYLRASYNQRLELLKGLVDSDGTIDKQRGRVTFSSVDKNLADGIAELARSLGEVVITNSGDRHGFGKTVTEYRVQWKPVVCPAALPRKVERFQPRKIAAYRAVKSIKKIDSVPTQCISVDSRTKTYLAGVDMVPTHNTVIRQLSRFMPKSTELQQAVAADNTVRVDTTPSAIDYPEYAEPAEEPIDVEEEPAGDD